ncbi:MAG TPA: PAS domain S-box protein [Gemmatimonadales bacterium]|nr:PAS domain S-box protein [Gemmatimonadales bacterium]
MSPDTHRAEADRLRAAVDSAPSGLLVVDEAGVIVLVNREIERLFGYARADLLGQPVEILVPERLRHPHPGYRSGFFSAPQARSMGAGRELFGLRRDGSEVPVEIGLTPVRTDDGLFVISAIVDITERRRAEARFRTAVESSPNGMVMVDHTGQIVLVNREVERLFGYSREELLGRSIDMLVPEAARGSHPIVREQFFQRPEARAMGSGRELHGVRKDGTEIPVEIGLNPIETEEGLLVLGSIVDISARKRAEGERRLLEEQLRQSQKMEAVGRLAGGIAHDFNNILGMITGFAELARDGEADAATRAADLEELLNAAARGRDLVQQILRFSRRQEVHRVPLDLKTSIPEAVRLLRATLPAGIDIRVSIPASLPRVLGDETSVHQVVMNLATNAAHAMPGGGLLEIFLEPFYARDSFVRAHPPIQEGPFVRLAVRDTGHGMDAETQSRAFEPFFTTKPLGSGTGLGLSMVHGIILDLGGAVWLRSEEQQGTEVSCLLPVLDEESADEDAGASLLAQPRDGAARILYVDDEPSLLEIGRRRLGAAGHAVRTAGDPREALRIFTDRATEFDLLITDLTMRGMNGLELAAAVHQVRPDLPILLLTGYLQEFAPVDLAAAGIRRVLNKPVSAGGLLEAIQSVLDEQ